MLFLAEHHASRFIANGILARISMEGDIAARCSGDYVMWKGVGLWSALHVSREFDATTVLWETRVFPQ